MAGCTIQASPVVPANWSQTNHSTIETEVAFRFEKSPYLELRRVICTMNEGVVTLSGRVSSHYLRQVAQATVLGLDGIRAIDNQLGVFAERNTETFGGED